MNESLIGHEFVLPTTTEVEHYQYEALLQAHAILAQAYIQVFVTTTVPYPVLAILGHAKNYLGKQIEQYLRG